MALVIIIRKQKARSLSSKEIEEIQKLMKQDVVFDCYYQ